MLVHNHVFELDISMGDIIQMAILHRMRNLPQNGHLGVNRQFMFQDIQFHIYQPVNREQDRDLLLREYHPVNFGDFRVVLQSIQVQNFILDYLIPLCL